eukprot:GEMP01034502.1.p1 GENE.GEMP01034502.1~~GEMP01034502.1.p1  ORF type:complete len:329 (+),score=35.84 GEMP01034502.1:102-1088(+)
MNAALILLLGRCVLAVVTAEGTTITRRLRTPTARKLSPIGTTIPTFHSGHFLYSFRGIRCLTPCINDASLNVDKTCRVDEKEDATDHWWQRCSLPSQDISGAPCEKCEKKASGDYVCAQTQGYCSPECLNNADCVMSPKASCVQNKCEYFPYSVLGIRCQTPCAYNSTIPPGKYRWCGVDKESNDDYTTQKCSMPMKDIHGDDCGGCTLQHSRYYRCALTSFACSPECVRHADCLQTSKPSCVKNTCVDTPPKPKKKKEGMTPSGHFTVVTTSVTLSAILLVQVVYITYRIVVPPERAKNKNSKMPLSIKRETSHTPGISRFATLYSF